MTILTFRYFSFWFHYHFQENAINWEWLYLWQRLYFSTGNITSCRYLPPLQYDRIRRFWLLTESPHNGIGISATLSSFQLIHREHRTRIRWWVTLRPICSLNPSYSYYLIYLSILRYDRFDTSRTRHHSGICPRATRGTAPGSGAVVTVWRRSHLVPLRSSHW